MSEIEHFILLSTITQLRKSRDKLRKKHHELKQKLAEFFDKIKYFTKDLDHDSFMDFFNASGWTAPTSSFTGDPPHKNLKVGVAIIPYLPEVH